MKASKFHHFNQHIPITMAQAPSRNNIETQPFPVKLYNMLEMESDMGTHQSLSWTPDGKSFVILDREKFMSHVVPLFFKQTKFRSFVSTKPDAIEHRTHRNFEIHRHIFLKTTKYFLHLLIVIDSPTKHLGF